MGILESLAAIASVGLQNEITKSRYKGVQKKEAKLLGSYGYNQDRQLELTFEWISPYSKHDFDEVKDKWLELAGEPLDPKRYNSCYKMDSVREDLVALILESEGYKFFDPYTAKKQHPKYAKLVQRKKLF